MPILRWALEQYANRPWWDDKYLRVLEDGNIQMFFFTEEELELAWFSTNEHTEVMTVFAALPVKFPSAFPPNLSLEGAGSGE
jgi:hypothetical protein